MKKLVIANIGTGEAGKSSSVKEVFRQLSTLYPSNVNVILDDGDIQAIIEVNGVLVGIESQGDPNSRMFRTLTELRTKGCQIIVCACRTSGATKQKVELLNTKHGYDLVWASNPYNETNKDYLNEKYARMIVKMIEDRISGKI